MPGVLAASFHLPVLVLANGFDIMSVLEQSTQTDLTRGDRSPPLNIIIRIYLDMESNFIWELQVSLYNIWILFWHV